MKDRREENKERKIEGLDGSEISRIMERIADRAKKDNWLSDVATARAQIMMSFVVLDHKMVRALEDQVLLMIKIFKSQGIMGENDINPFFQKVVDEREENRLQYRELRKCMDKLSIDEEENI